MNNYLDQERIKKDFPGVFTRYSETHTVIARQGTRVDITKLNKNESIVYGDGETFHFLLTKK